MNAQEMRDAFEAVFDEAIVFHGFTDYLRDYEIIVYVTADPRTGIQPVHARLLFKHCVQASATSALSPETWRASLDDRLIDYEQGADLDGYVWGVKWQMLYPGISLLDSRSLPGHGRRLSASRFMRHASRRTGTISR